MTHGSNTEVLVNECDLSALLRNASTARARDSHETTTFKKAAKTFRSGLRSGTVSFDGLFQGDADLAEAELEGAITREDDILTVGLVGGAHGTKALLAKADATTYEIQSPSSDVVSVTAEFQADGGVAGGKVLHALGAEVAADEGAAVNTGAGAEGGVGHLHVTAFSGAPATLDVLIEHSDDGATGWSTLITFAQLTGKGSERVETTTAAKAYTRASWTPGSGDSFTFAVAFAPRR